MPTHEIWAQFDSTHVVVYQACSHAAAEAALAAHRIAFPRLPQRRAWVEPSLLWLLARSDWGQRPGQERILALQVPRHGFDTTLSDPSVRVRWGHARSPNGKTLPHRAVQLGLAAKALTLLNNELPGIEDITPRVRRIHALCQAGRSHRARRLLPREEVYPVPSRLRSALGLEPISERSARPDGVFHLLQAG